MDEPERDAPPQADEVQGGAEAPALEGPAFDSMSEEELLAGIQGLVAPERSDDG